MEADERNELKTLDDVDGCPRFADELGFGGAHV